MHPNYSNLAMEGISPLSPIFLLLLSVYMSRPKFGEKKEGGKGPNVRTGNSLFSHKLAIQPKVSMEAKFKATIYLLVSPSHH